MTTQTWVSVAAVVVAYIWVAWEVHHERRYMEDVAADLDETRGELDELRVYVSHLAEYVTEQADATPSQGRHAWTGEQPAA